MAGWAWQVGLGEWGWRVGRGELPCGCCFAGGDLRMVLCLRFFGVVLGELGVASWAWRVGLGKLGLRVVMVQKTIFFEHLERNT